MWKAADRALRKAAGDGRTPWILRLPAGLRHQPAWVWIGLLLGLAGVSYVVGFTESSITEAVPPATVRVWGFFLAFGGFGVMVATLRADAALEKLALRVMSVCMAVYMGWLLVVVDFRRAVFGLALVVSLIGLAEVRIAVLKLWLNSKDDGSGKT